LGTHLLIVVGYNCLPDTTSISFISAENAYVIYTSHEIIDTEGNNNGIADFGEAISLTVSLSNIGTEDATDVTANITIDDEYISLSDSIEVYGFIAADETIFRIEAFSFNVSNSVPDQHTVVFHLVCESEGVFWMSDFEIIINAPLPEIGDMIIDDNTGGNGNGQLDPG